MMRNLLIILVAGVCFSNCTSEMERKEELPKKQHTEYTPLDTSYGKAIDNIYFGPFAGPLPIGFKTHQDRKPYRTIGSYSWEEEFVIDEDSNIVRLWFTKDCSTYLNAGFPRYKEYSKEERTTIADNVFSEITDLISIKYGQPQPLEDNGMIKGHRWTKVNNELDCFVVADPDEPNMPIMVVLAITHSGLFDSYLKNLEKQVDKHKDREAERF